jgi:parallel beta-helix repeat protein
MFLGNQSSDGRGVNCDGGDNNIISNNTITAPFYANGFGIYLDSDNSSVCGNSINGFEYGLYCDVDYNANISNNRFTNQGFAAAQFNFYANTDFGGNVVSGNNVYHSLTHGFSVSPAFKTTFTGNNVLGCRSNGFYGGTSGVISYMSLVGNRFDYNGGSGIYLNQGAQNTSHSIFNGNSCTNNTGYGIYVEDATNSIFTANHFTGNGTDSDITDTGGCVIANNYNL